MGLPFAADPTGLPMHVLFPDEYRATRRQIVRDFAILGAAIVLSVVGFCYLYG